MGKSSKPPTIDELMSNPPKGHSSVHKPCEHNYEFLYSDFDKMDGPGLTYYEQKDTFYCSKCLEYRTKISRTANERYKPEWYKGV